MADLFAQFRADIRNFLNWTGMSATALSVHTMKSDRGIVTKWLRGEGNPTVGTMQQIYDFMSRYKK